MGGRRGLTRPVPAALNGDGSRRDRVAMQLSDDALRRYAEIAGQAARSTRGILSRKGRGVSVPVSQIGRDIKLEEDARSEAAIRAYLAANTPFAVLGEEGGWAGREEGADALHWVVDPLDGSFNYHRGIPLYAVAVALCAGRRAMVGAIFDPERDELFTGGEGLGFAINGVGGVSPGVARQILATGFPARADVDATSARIAAHARDWTKVRMIGSAALALAWVAAGRMDGYAETGVMWWDVAAGLALARGAGLAEITVRALDGHAVDVLVSR